MSRIRSIKPEFWTSAQVMECSPNARLLFIGLWNFCDDAGRHPASPRRIKAEIYPGDDFTSENIRGMLDELASVGLIVYYTIDNEDYLYVTGWQHQKIDKPQKPKYPAPADDHSPTSRRTFATEGITERITETSTLSPAKPPEREPEKLDGQRPPHRSANDEAWERFKGAYPKRKGDFEWKTARERFDRAIRDGTDPEAIIAGAARYAEQQRSLGHIGTPYVKQASSFMAARTWEEFHDQPKANGQHGPSPPKDDHDAEMRLHVGRDNRKWPTPKWGAMPNRPGCLIPPHLIKPDDGEGWTEWEQ